MPETRETIRKIETFNALSYRTALAVCLVQFGDRLGLNRSNAFSGEQGEIGIDFYTNKNQLEITVERDDTFTVELNKHKRRLSLNDRLHISEAYRAIKRFAKQRVKT